MPEHQDKQDVLDAKLEKEAAVGKAFSPAAPIHRRELFAGRTREIRKLIEIVSSRGQHGVLWGERGVGKTSLASVSALIVADPTTIAVRVNCDGSDDFGTIWAKALERIEVVRQSPGVGFSPEERELITNAAENLPDRPAPRDIELALTAVSQVAQVAIFFDEFDRVTDPDASRLMADTMKTLSDQGLPATIILVGVADDVDQLVMHHESIERALGQIRMPRMSRDELREIVSRGLSEVGMSIDDDARDRITALSQGLPHYTHLLAQEAAKSAVWSDETNIGMAHVVHAMREAVDRTGLTLAERYHKATSTSRERTLYPSILVASALAPGDELGYFAATDVRDPLRAITRKAYEIPAFSPHLHELSEVKRGSVLQKTGEPRRFRFRFRNPLMQPYVIMRALSDGLLTFEVLDKFLVRQREHQHI